MPDAVAISPDGARIDLANKDANTVSIVEAGPEAAPAQTGPAATIPVVRDHGRHPGVPLRLALSPSGNRAYVAHLDGNLVTFVDAEGRRPTVLVRVGETPLELTVSGDGRRQRGVGHRLGDRHRERTGGRHDPGRRLPGRCRAQFGRPARA